MYVDRNKPSSTHSITSELEEEGAGDSQFAQQEQATAEEIQMSAKETSRIRMFRIMVVGMLLMTMAVTIMAYFLLGAQENRNFETAVRRRTS